MSIEDDTIVALSSGVGKSAVAVIRASGARTRFALETVCGGVPRPRFATLRTIRDPSGATIDSGLVLFFPAPSSFTGEDMAEFQVHGGRAVVRRLLAALTDLPGLRLAEAGEFARRALLHGKLDLTRAEGIADLIDSDTERQRQQAAMLAAGGLAGRAENWRGRLIALQGRLAAEIDFADEGDVPAGVAHGVSGELRALAREVETVLATADRGVRLSEGVRVVIAGPPNAGKSSLLNALARRDVAITSEHAGTTRDVIRVSLDIGGVSVILSDTAGRREASDPVERIGVLRAAEEALAADVVLWVSDKAAPPPDDLRGKTIRLLSKCDLAGTDIAATNPEALRISVRTGEGLDALERILGERCERLVDGEPAYVTGERQRACLIAGREALALALAEADSGVEIMAENLRRVIEALDRLVGRIGVEEILGEVFARFCVGK